MVQIIVCGEMEDASKLRRLLTCPICGEILQDPCIVSTCQHCFCFSCINRGIEYGCAPCRLPWEAPADDTVASEDDEKPRKRKRRRQVTFACPVCGLAAFKWMLHRVAPLSAFVNRVRAVLVTVPFHPPVSHGAKGVARGDETTSSSCCAPDPTSAGSLSTLQPLMIENESMRDLAATSGKFASGSSVALFDESLPLWQNQQHTDHSGVSTNSVTPLMDAASAVLGGGCRPLSQNFDPLYPCSRDGHALVPPAAVLAPPANHTSDTSELSLCAFVSTPPPASPPGVEEMSENRRQAVISDGDSQRETNQVSFDQKHYGEGSTHAAVVVSQPSTSFDRLLSPVHPPSCSLRTTTSSARRAPEDSPIRFVPQPVCLLLDASIWGIADRAARGKYMDVVHLAAARLGGSVINAVTPSTLEEICRSSGDVGPASHIVCLSDPAVSKLELSAAQCEAQITTTTKVVGLEWVVQSVERGAWQLHQHQRPASLSLQSHPTAAPFANLGVVLDLGRLSAVPDGGNVDFVLLRSLQSALRLVFLGSAAAVWVAWVAADGTSKAHLVGQVPLRNGVRCGLFDIPDECNAETSSSVSGALILSVHGQVKDAVVQPSDVAALLLSKVLRGCNIARRSLEWLYRILLLDGVGEWERVRGQLVKGALSEWEHQRPNTTSLLYGQQTPL